MFLSLSVSLARVHLNSRQKNAFSLGKYAPQNQRPSWSKVNWMRKDSPEGTGRILEQSEKVLDCGVENTGEKASVILSDIVYLMHIYSCAKK